MVTAVVPVKAKSERLPQKNLRFFVNCSLYIHKLRQLQGTPFDRIVVSSESKDIIKIAKNYGYCGHLRNPKYSTPDIPMNEVYSYIASEVPGDDIAWVNITNPLVTGEHYKKILECWNVYRALNDCLLSIYKLQKYVFWNKEPLNWIPSQHPKSQDLDGLLAMSFAINIRPREDVIKYGSFIGKDPFFYYLNKYISTKIDYEEDLEFCRILWKRKSL